MSKQNEFLIESGAEELINNNSIIVLRCFGRWMFAVNVVLAFIFVAPPKS